MQWSHAPRIGERGHPRGFQDSGEQRRSPNFKLGFRLFFPVVRHFLLSIKYHPSQDVQWHPTTGARGIDKAISRAYALRKLGTYQLLFSWECTLQPVTSETGEMAVFERLRRPRQLTGKFMGLHVQNAQML
jgi:hypothetical protein